jgi:hypothetical protein
MTIYAQTISTPSQLRDAFHDADRADGLPTDLDFWQALLDFLDADPSAPYCLDVIGVCCDLNATTPQEFQRYHADDCPDPCDYYTKDGFDDDTYHADICAALEEAVQENACYLYTDSNNGTVYYFGEL